MEQNFNLKPPERIILYDGVCNLCHAAVQFILKRDTTARFKFAALRSPLGLQLLKLYRIDLEKIDSIVLISNAKAHIYSAAALRIAWHLGGFWRLLTLGWFVPYFLRDWVYILVAKNRYNWWGKNDGCLLPRAEWKNRFLD